MAYESIPLPRRKSCEACKTAKRRCDLGLPACSRCIHRDVACVYPWRQPCENLSEAPPLINLPGDLQETFNTTCQIQPSLDLHPQPVFPVMTGVVDSLPGCHNQWSHFSGISMELPDREINAGPNFDLTIPRARHRRPLPEVIANNLQFAIDILEQSPRMMVLENQTPWCHPKLYQNYMPRAMQGKSSVKAYLELLINAT